MQRDAVADDRRVLRRSTSNVDLAAADEMHAAHAVALAVFIIRLRRAHLACLKPSCQPYRPAWPPAATSFASVLADTRADRPVRVREASVSRQGVAMALVEGVYYRVTLLYTQEAG